MRNFIVKPHSKGTLIEFRFIVKGGYENIRQHNFDFEVTEQELSEVIEQVKADFGIIDVFGRNVNSNITRILKMIENKHKKEPEELDSACVSGSTAVKRLARLLNIPFHALYGNMMRIKINRTQQDIADYVNLQTIHEEPTFIVRVGEYTALSKSVMFVVDIHLRTTRKEFDRFIMYVQNNEVTKVHDIILKNFGKKSK